jgi:membrane-bound lytic murein transglycosylase D
MKHRQAILLATLAAALISAGCEETVSQVKVKPPAPAPQVAAASPAAAPGVVNPAAQMLPFQATIPAIHLLPPPVRPAIDLVVAQAQASFDAGSAELKAGQADKAQTDFDRAVKILVASGFSTDADPRISKLVDDLGDYVQTDDLDALSAADTAQAQVASQPAPIDEIADLTLPPGDPRLAAMAQKELFSVQHDLPLTVNESVLQYLNFFTTTRGHAIVEHGLERAGRYEPMIRRVLAEEGVPQDLIYLAQAESAFQPQAVSRSGARGIWQFMPYRGEQYNLDRSYWVDERSDPEKATHAAAHHLRDLYGIFGDWYLVMAAYNSGPLNVARAIERTGYADFWELQKRKALPKETENYVPIILALALVAKDPSLYGVHVDVEKPPQVDTLRLDHSIDLHLVADASGADFDDLRLLNPQLLRSVTPGDSSFQLKLPAGKAKSFEDNIQQIPEDKWTSWRLHSVEQGETLASIARQYRVTIASIESANHLDASANLPSGFWLSVPAPPPAPKLVHYRVQRGDTLDAIADRFDVTVAQLKRWNGLKGANAPRGARLRIYAGGEPAAPSPSRRSKSADASTPAPVRAGAAAHAALLTPAKAAAPVTHRVRTGETLYSIAKEYQTTVAAIVAQNGFLSSRSLRAGDLLALQQ